MRIQLYSVVTPGANAAAIHFATESAAKGDFLGDMKRILGEWQLLGTRGEILWHVKRERPQSHPSAARNFAWGRGSTPEGEFTLGEVINLMRGDLAKHH